MISFAMRVNWKSQIQAMVKWILFSRLFFIFDDLLYCSCFCFNYIIEKGWRWDGEVKRSENSLDIDGRKNEFYLNDICERGTNR